MVQATATDLGFPSEHPGETLLLKTALTLVTEQKINRVGTERHQQPYAAVW